MVVAALDSVTCSFALHKEFLESVHSFFLSVSYKLEKLRTKTTLTCSSVVVERWLQQRWQACDELFRIVPKVFRKCRLLPYVFYKLEKMVNRKELNNY